MFPIISSPAKLPFSFLQKKSSILRDLEVPQEEYSDLSPKGSIDEPIRDLIEKINAREGLVTTSSCSGRVTVFLEGRKNAPEDAAHTSSLPNSMPQIATVGGKGGGGKWLFVSHNPLNLELMGDQSSSNKQTLQEIFGLEADEGTNSTSLNDRYAHFKFESMVLHIHTASLYHAHIVISAAVQAGFRETGAINIQPSKAGDVTPMVGIRAHGLALDCIVGRSGPRGDVVHSMVSESFLQTVVRIANDRFLENSKRIRTFEGLLLKAFNRLDSKEPLLGETVGLGKIWEDQKSRAERKRAEGLQRQQQLRANVSSQNDQDPLQFVEFLP